VLAARTAKANEAFFIKCLLVRRMANRLIVIYRSTCDSRLLRAAHIPGVLRGSVGAWRKPRPDTAGRQDQKL
jgi:hypothetical protein